MSIHVWNIIEINVQTVKNQFSPVSMILSIPVVLSVVPVSIPIPVVSVVSAPTVIHLFSSLSDPYLILQSLLLNLLVVSCGLKMEGYRSFENKAIHSFSHLSLPKCSFTAPKQMGICHFFPHLLFLLFRVTWTCVQSPASTFLLS